jgi:capsular exopolysaccharide synthesis family protein
MWQWWKVAVPIGLIMAAIACIAIWLSYKPMYSTSAWLRVEQGNPYVVFNTSEKDRGFSGAYLSIIKTPFVLEPVVSKPEIAQLDVIQEQNEPAKWLGQVVQITSQRGSPYAQVGVTAVKPEWAQAICNAVVESYFKVQSQEEAVRTQRVLDLLQEEQNRRADVVTRLREELRELRIKETGETNGGGSPLQLPINSILSKLSTSDVTREIWQAQLTALKEDYDPDSFQISQEAMEKYLVSHPQIQQMERRRQQMLARLDQIEAIVADGKNSPRYQELLEAYRDEGKNFDIAREEIAREFFIEQKKAWSRSRLKQIAELERRINDSLVVDEVYKKRYMAQLEALKAAEGGVVLDVAFKQAELAREEQVFGLISQRVMRIRTELRSPAKITLQQEARLPRSPSTSPPFKIMGLAALISLGVPFGLAVVWEYLIRRVDGPQQLWQANLSVIGEIAKLPVRSRGASTDPFGSVGRDVSLFEESIDSLRTSLVLSEGANNPNILVVTSAVSGEGKTSVASQLAVSIARSSGEPTLLIDADMRSPDIHNVFDVPNEPGLAQVLGRECTVKDAIITTWSKYVHILPAGVLEASPHKLLGDGALKALLDEARKTYRHVVIDTSPILSASESLVLAKSADATLLCAMKGSSRVDQVQRAYERLVNTGARPLGTVLNGVPTGRYAYLYGIYSYPRD